MPCLAPRTDLGQLRRQAEQLLRAAQHGDTDALARLHAVSDRLILDSALLAVAREYGFASWAKLKTEVKSDRSRNGRQRCSIVGWTAGSFDLTVAHADPFSVCRCASGPTAPDNGAVVSRSTLLGAQG